MLTDVGIRKVGPCYSDFQCEWASSNTNMGIDRRNPIAMW